MASDSHDSSVTTFWVVEDNADYRIELVDVLHEVAGFRVTQSFTCADEMIRFLAAVPNAPAPDLVLMDIGMPGTDGISGVQVLLPKYPGLRVAMLTEYDDPEKMYRALQAGAVGFVQKLLSIEQIIQAIRHILAGQLVMATSVARKVQEHFEKKRPFHLTPREAQVLPLLAEGDTQAVIADKLGISADTVNNHVRNILDKFKVRSATAAVNRAHQGGYL